MKKFTVRYKNSKGVLCSQKVKAVNEMQAVKGLSNIISVMEVK
jgi:hypothetical protein